MNSTVLRTLLLAGLTCIIGRPAEAQVLSLTASIKPALGTTNDPITVNDQMRVSMVLRNNTDAFINNVKLNVSFSEAIDYVNATNSVQNGTAGVVGSAVVYDIPGLGARATANLSLDMFALQSGLLTLFLDYTGNGLVPQTDELEIQVYSAEADLGVALVSPTNTVVEADWITYRLSVTNRGPDRVGAVVVTTGWPTNTGFISMSPNLTRTLTGTGMTFTTGAVGTNQSAFFDITIQPNALGQGELTAKLSVDNLLDPNPDNNATTNMLSVAAAEPANLSVTVVSPQTFNPQTGLMEQTIRLTNNGATNIATARVVVEEFTAQVFNAAGTNAANPYVTLTRPLAPAESVDLVMEYFIPSRTAVPDASFTPLSVPQFIPNAPAGTSIPIDASFNLSDGKVLIEFSSEPGDRYVVVYSDNAQFTNALQALPAVAAPANRVQWIDAGPPKTTLRPDNTSMRFYRVIEIPE